MNVTAIGAAAVSPASDVDAWLKANSQGMTTCSRLPGQPRVSRGTCLKRQGLAHEIANRKGNESLFDGGGPVGLDACLNCPDAFPR